MKNQPSNWRATAFKKNLTLTFLTALILLVKPFSSHAQSPIPDSDGAPLTETGPASEVESGSRFYKLDWANGTVTRKDGTTYQGLKLKYDLYDDEIVYESTANAPLVPKYTDITGFTLKGLDGATDVKTFANGFPAVDKLTPASYYQVIAAGKTQLLKKYAKTISTRTDPGDNSIVKSFVDEELYYVLKDGKMTAVKPDAKEIEAVLADKGTQVAAYVKSNKLGYKHDEDLAKIFAYYNTL